MVLRPNDPRSPARQIVDDLRRRIALGELAAGDQLPSNAEMRTLYEVSNQTAQNAIAALKRDDLVYSVPGRGVFVRTDLDLDDLRSQLSGDEGQPELYGDLLARIVELDDAQSKLTQALADITERVEIIEERQGEGQHLANQPPSVAER